eukprot:GHVU01162436.1.p1 GENE.GHVU01162436.1~~GHVU01162436.1.p1  ORF type:complete len:212 (-),score=34.00 GHVU01162436.1:624-1259(-)
MPTYKLIYFDARGRAETTRMLFKLAGIQFVDERFTDDEWVALKPKNPFFGQVPLLEVDGQKICQSRSIIRYVAKITGYSGKTAFDEARADMIVESLEDIINPMFSVGLSEELTAEQQKEGFAKLASSDGKIPQFLAAFENILKSNKGGDGYFIGADMTYADIEFMNVTKWFEVFNISVDWSKYPKLQALRERVAANSVIQDWLKTRPVTEF